MARNDYCDKCAHLREMKTSAIPTSERIKIWHIGIETTVKTVDRKEVVKKGLERIFSYIKNNKTLIPALSNIDPCVSWLTVRSPHFNMVPYEHLTASISTHGPLRLLYRICTKCHYLNNYRDFNCRKCGTDIFDKLKIRCDKCGFLNNANNDIIYCEKCGTQIRGEAPPTTD